MSKESQKYGLQRVYQAPRAMESGEGDMVDIVAIHGLDTQSPRTWIAWKIDGDPKSGDVHWLKDETMLPAVIPNSRIFTYDWSASLDRNPGTQFLLGHATDFLSKLYMARLQEGNDRPIIFIASCFGGLLFAKALYRAAESSSKFRDILKCTAGIAFLGTPFQGSHRGFYTAAQLRVTVALSMGSGAADHLAKYLNSDANSRESLDELVRLFTEMIFQKRFSFDIICFHETMPTDFRAVVKNLPPEFVEHLGNDSRGILVEEHSACLQGPERHGLNVRHSMLSKYASPDNDDFIVVSSHLLEFATKARQRNKKRTDPSYIFALGDNPYGVEIATWLIQNRPQEIQESDILTLIYKSGTLRKLNHPSGDGGISVLGRLSESVQSVIGQGLQHLASVISSAAVYATASKTAEKKTANEMTDEAKLAKEVYTKLKQATAEVHVQTQDALLLDPNIIDSLGETAVDEIATTVGAKPALDLKQTVIRAELTFEVDELELSSNSIEFSPGVPRGSRFRCGVIQEKHILVEMIPYTTAEDSTDISAKDLHQIRRMIGQLSHPERTSAHVLRCAGFIHYRYEQQIGLVFYLKNNCDITSPPVTLSSLYNSSSNKVGPTAKSLPTKVSLGLRFQVAKNLAVALEGLHRVGWVHKDIQSKNVAFFNSATSIMTGTASLGSLYLFGFESSRPDDAETDLKADYSLKSNAYRHPDRWGKPNVKFTKVHDIYSLGIVFLELACWKSIFELKFKNLKETQRCEPEALRREVIKAAREDIPFMTGVAFANIIETCLTFDEISAGMNEYEVYELFKQRVVNVLSRIVVAGI
ncbi:hypothetical protein V8C42DRAFT_360055 [Trichoderma barbatum]